MCIHVSEQDFSKALLLYTTCIMVQIAARPIYHNTCNTITSVRLSHAMKEYLSFASHGPFFCFPYDIFLILQYGILQRSKQVNILKQCKDFLFLFELREQIQESRPLSTCMNAKHCQVASSH